MTKEMRENYRLAQFGKTMSEEAPSVKLFGKAPHIKSVIMRKKHFAAMDCAFLSFGT